MDLIKPSQKRWRRVSTQTLARPPKLVQSLDALDAAWSASTLRAMLSSFRRKRLLVGLPKFEVDNSIGLNDALNELGMKKAFLPDEAGFSGMVQQQPTWIDVLKQRCYVRVDECGTEAAAATATMIVGSAFPQPPPPPMFVANHPFLFLVRNTRSDTIVFMGRVVDPTGGHEAPAEAPPLIRRGWQAREWWKRFFSTREG